MRTTCAVAVALLAVSGADASAAETKTTPFKGVTRIHRTGVTVGGAVQDYHVVLVDLREPTLRVAVSPQADRNKTTSAIASKHRAKVAINGSFFTYNDREPCGATLSGGAFWTNAYRGCPSTMAFGYGNGAPSPVAMVSTGNDVDGPLPSAAFAKDAISGKPWVLKNGQSTAPWSDPSHINERNPRSAIGYTANGAKLVMLVADGRRAGAAGMVGADLVTVMKELGAVDALNLDGGGSSTLVVGGTVANDPSDGSQRPVSNAVMIVGATPKPSAGADASLPGAGSEPGEPGGAEPDPPSEETGSAGAGRGANGAPDGDLADVDRDDDAGCAVAPRVQTGAIAFVLAALAALFGVRRSASRSASPLRAP